MIPVLYDPDATTFETNGRGGLSDAITCTVTEERNGAYELAIVYPLDGAHFSDIENGAVIKAFCGTARQWQPFRVYTITRPLNGQVTILAHHISYQLSLIPCSPFTATTAAGALAGLKSHAAEPCPFEFTTNKTTVANYAQTAPESIRSRLGGVRGSILDVYGGEFEFNGYNVRLWDQRGQDRGVVIRYGKNLTDLKQEASIANTITGVYPFYQDTAGNYVELPEKVISASSAASYPFPRTVPLDLSGEFEDVPTVAQLRTKARTYISGNRIGVPSVSLSLSFANMADTLEYADRAAAEQVELCDTVGVIFERLGVQASAKVIKTTWDVLAGRYLSIDVGDARTTLADTIAETQQEAKETAAAAVTGSALQEAIRKATDAITGASGGVIRFNYNANGEPYELLILDTGDIATATHVWRFNSGGWGYSSSGYGGPYTLAATINGGIVADYITAGTLTSLNINNGNGTFTVDTAGAVTASNMTITGGNMAVSTSGLNDEIIVGTYTNEYDSGGVHYIYKYTAAVTAGAFRQTSTTTSYPTGSPSAATTTAYRLDTSASGVSILYQPNGASTWTTLATLTSGGVYFYNTSGTIVGSINTAGSLPQLLLYGATRALLKMDADNGLGFYNSGGSLIGAYTTAWKAELDKVKNTGTASSATASNTSLTSGTWGTVTSITHEAGTYLVTAAVSFNTANATGRRLIAVTSSGTSSTPVQTNARDERTPTTGATTLSVTFIRTDSSGGTWYLRAFQSTGGAYVATASILQIVKLRDN